MLSSESNGFLFQTRVPSTTQKMDFAELVIHSKNELCAYDVLGTETIVVKKAKLFYPHDTYFLVGKKENTILNT